MGYSKDTFESLFTAYIENPNVISGRRSHLIKYKNNGDINGYYKWIYEQKLIKDPDFRVVLTNVGGSIFPPDILDINDNLLPIIKETITCDDLTLKYFSNLKGIPQKWIVNKNINGIQRKLPKTKDSPLSQINFKNNNVCINKLNMMVNKTIIKNLCAQYRDIPTGNSIYLFEKHNEIIDNNLIYFNIYAYSFCPIDNNIKFNISFGNSSSICFFNKSKTIISQNNLILKNNNCATCYLNYTGNNLDNYNFPSSISEDNITINIYNYRKSVTIIFKQFFCKGKYNCIIKVVLFENIFYDKFSVIINDKQYICEINDNYIFFVYRFAYIKAFRCNPSNSTQISIKTFVSGIPNNINLNKRILDNNIIPNIFIISRIIFDKEKKGNKILIIGKLAENLKDDIYYFYINIFYPKINLKCYLKPNSNYVQSRINCITNMEINSEILIENQIINSINVKKELLLINEETFIKMNLNETSQYILEKNKDSINSINN